MTRPTTTRTFLAIRLLLAIGLLLWTLPGSLAEASLTEALANRPTPTPDNCPTLLGCGVDLNWALDLENKILDNMWDGQIYEVDYRTRKRVSGDLVSVNHFGDSALWTGTYLAAQSFRYALASRYLSEPTLKHPKSVFWQAQKADAKSRVDKMVAKYHVLANISQSWNHELQPSPQQPGFGGGVFSGEPGYLMRACVPAGVPAWQTWGDIGPDPTGMPPPYTANRRVFGPLPWHNAGGTVTEYFCEDGTSRDAYAGTTFGLLTAFDLVSPDDLALRNQIRDDVITLTNFAVKYHWNTPRPHGRVSLPLPVDDVAPCSACGHDFENFASPLFVTVPLARLNMAQAARHVAHAAPGRDDVAKWDAVWAEELATQLPVLALSMEFDAFQPNESYYKYNLHHLTGYNVTRLEADPSVKTLFKQALGVMDRTTGDDVNTHFETVTFALTGEAARLGAAVAHVRDWRDYRARIDVDPATNNSQYCGKTIQCVPQDQLGIDGVTIPGSATKLRAAGPLPVAVRPPTDFLWQRPPTQLDGNESPNHQAPGIDYLLPYWMLRYYTEGPMPPLEPFPAWAGPAHF